MARKCFISFKTEDIAYKHAIQEMGIDMVDKSLDLPIDSEDEDYIMRKIREDYLADSTVTIHLIGANSAENLGQYEQRFIKRELQASLYNGENNSRNGILGVALPHVAPHIYAGSIACYTCNGTHNCVKIDDNTAIREFSYNYYIPHGKCAHTEDDRYCVLVTWEQFIQNTTGCIEQAFMKREHPIANKIRVRP